MAATKAAKSKANGKNVGRRGTLVRMQVDMEPDFIKEMDEMQVLSQTNARRDHVMNALTLYHEVLRRVKVGDAVGFREDGKWAEFISAPILTVKNSRKK